MGESYWLGYAKGGKELDVMDHLDRLGISFWRGERIKFERRGKSREAEPFIYPALPNYIFLSPEPCQLKDLHNIKYLAKRFKQVPVASMRSISSYQNEVANRMLDAKRAVDNQEAIFLYKKGQELTIKDGPFEGFLAEFEQNVKMFHDPYAKIKASVNVFGRKTLISLDPLSVKEAV